MNVHWRSLIRRLRIKKQPRNLSLVLVLITLNMILIYQRPYVRNGGKQGKNFKIHYDIVDISAK